MHYQGSIDTLGEISVQKMRPDEGKESLDIFHIEQQHFRNLSSF